MGTEGVDKPTSRKCMCCILIIITTQRRRKMSEVSLENIFTSQFICKVWKGYSRFSCERELETKHNCNILTSTLMAVSVVSFSFPRAAQLEAQRPTLLVDGFLYCILSATSLDPNSSGAPRSPLAWRGFSYHTLSATYHQL